AASRVKPLPHSFFDSGRRRFRSIFFLALALAAGRAVTLGTEPAPVTYREWQSPAGLPDDKTTDLVQSTDGFLWVASHGGVARFADGTVTRFGEKDGVAASSACFVTADRDGTIWATTGNALLQFHDGTFHQMAAIPTGTKKLAPARTDGVWLGQGRRVRRFV